MVQAAKINTATALISHDLITARLSKKERNERGSRGDAMANSQSKKCQTEKTTQLDDASHRIQQPALFSSEYVIRTLLYPRWGKEKMGCCKFSSVGPHFG
jgi:hypothetical protein